MHGKVSTPLISKVDAVWSWVAKALHTTSKSEKVFACLKTWMFPQFTQKAPSWTCGNQVLAGFPFLDPRGPRWRCWDGCRAGTTSVLWSKHWSWIRTGGFFSWQWWSMIQLFNKLLQEIAETACAGLNRMSLDTTKLAVAIVLDC